MRAGSLQCSCGDWDGVRVSGKAVASTGPLTMNEDRRDRQIAVFGDIGGAKMDNNSEDPRKTHI